MVMNRFDLTASLDKHARFPLATVPTPVEVLPGLAKHLELPTLLVKRDDLTGLALGGNKARALEHIVGDALARGCDVFISGGGVAQSNHGRLCAAAARKAGLDPVLVLRRQPGAGVSGNALIIELLGAEVHWVDEDPQLRDRLATARRMDEVADVYRARGRRPYVLHSSVDPLGVLGYLRCTLELTEQLAQLGVERATVIATSEGVVLTGLRLGVALLGLPWTVLGVGWRPAQLGTAERLAALAAQTCELLGVDSPLSAEDLVVLDHGGPAYGVADEAAWQALALCARSDALLLDPVYTAKGMAGLIHAVTTGGVDRESTPVFLHTGGLPALFAAPEQVLASVRRQADRDMTGSA